MNKWIKCSNRLPEKDVDVLVYSDFWEIIIASRWDEAGRFYAGEVLPLGEFSHWMPLPKPPEEDE